jgi:probable addiction module antidote protein
MTTRREKHKRFDVAAYLGDLDDVAGYLELALEKSADDPASVPRALGVIARAQNMSELARRVGMSRDGLYKALSEEGNPTWSTILKVTRALGLRFELHPTESPQQIHEPLTGPAGRRVAAHRSELLDVLRRHRVTNPEVFGSAARGDDHEGSDLDLLVDFPPGTDLIDMVNIKLELEAILGAPVDLVPRDGLKERVRIAAERDLVAL